MHLDQGIKDLRSDACRTPSNSSQISTMESITMGVTVNITLQDLQCIRQDRGSDGSYPFLWPAMVAINTTNGKVMVAGSEAPSLARVILDNGMKSGDSGAIPSTVGLNGFRFDENLADFKLIAIVALLEKRDLSDDEILGGFLV